MNHTPYTILEKGLNQSMYQTVAAVYVIEKQEEDTRKAWWYLLNISDSQYRRLSIQKWTQCY